MKKWTEEDIDHIWTLIEVCTYVFIWLCCLGFCNLTLTHKKTGEVMYFKSWWG